MKKYPDADDFTALAGVVLETIRPYTARWHAMRGPPPEGRFLGYQIHFNDEGLKLIDRFSSNYGLFAKIDYAPAVTRSQEKRLGWML